MGKKHISPMLSLRKCGKSERKEQTRKKKTDDEEKFINHVLNIGILYVYVGALLA